MVRLSHSHIRIGTFQRLAAHGLTDETRRLTEHCITHFWPEAANAPDPAAGLYDAITGAVARMGAEWFAAGFVHGVLNTDNVNITGESFDYGPWRFLDRFDPAFTAAYFDQTGLYCFARQPEALNWNLARLGECLIPISSQEAIAAVFESFAERFQADLARQTFARLGLLPGDPAAARSLMHGFWAAMQATSPPFQQVFHDLLGGGLPDRLHASPIMATYDAPEWTEVMAGLGKLEPAPGLAAALAACPPGRHARDHDDRGSRGDLVGDRRVRRLATAPRQDRSHSPLRRVQRDPRPDDRSERTAGASADHARLNRAAAENAPNGRTAPRSVRSTR